MHGTRVANWAMDEADLIVAIGARFDDRVTGALDEFAPHAKVVHIDIDATEIGKNVAGRTCRSWATRSSRWRRCAASTRKLDARRRSTSGGRGSAAGRRDDAPRSRADAGGRARRAGRRARRRDRDHRRRPAPDVGGRPAALRRAAALDHERRARHDGLRPAGRARRPGRRARATVVCVSGEGSFLMNVQELATAVEEALPVKVLLLDNASLGMVRQQQDLFWGGRRTRGRPRREPRLGAAGPRVRRGPCARSATATRSPTRWRRRSPRTAPRCSTSVSLLRRTACRCSARAGRRGR